eukprot:3201670-Pyramimonas_sp.AAC.1
MHIRESTRGLIVSHAPPRDRPRTSARPRGGAEEAPKAAPREWAPGAHPPPKPPAGPPQAPAKRAGALP